MRRLGVLAILIGLSFSAWSQTVRLGMARMLGSGCPQGSVSAVLSPDQSTVSLLFDSFLIEVPRGAGQIANKDCRFVIQTEVDEGWVINAVAIDYRGYASLPPGGSAVIGTSNLLKDPSSGRPIYQQSSLQSGRMGMDDEFLVRQSSRQSVVQECRPQTHLDFMTSLTLSTLRVRGRTDQDALLVLDSVDLSLDDSPISIELSVSRCREARRPPPSRDRRLRLVR